VWLVIIIPVVLGFEKDWLRPFGRVGPNHFVLADSMAKVSDCMLSKTIVVNAVHLIDSVVRMADRAKQQLHMVKPAQ